MIREDLIKHLQSLEELFQGQDAVVSTLGFPKTGDGEVSEMKKYPKPKPNSFHVWWESKNWGLPQEVTGFSTAIKVIVSAMRRAKVWSFQKWNWQRQTNHALLPFWKPTWPNSWAEMICWELVYLLCRWRLFIFYLCRWKGWSSPLLGSLIRPQGIQIHTTHKLEVMHFIFRQNSQFYQSNWKVSLDCNRTQSNLCFVFKFVPWLQNVLDDQNRMEVFLEREVPQLILVFFCFLRFPFALCLGSNVQVLCLKILTYLLCYSLQLFTLGQKYPLGWARSQVGGSQTWDSELGSKVRGNQVATTHSWSQAGTCLGKR